MTNEEINWADTLISDLKNQISVLKFIWNWDDWSRTLSPNTK